MGAYLSEPNLNKNSEDDGNEKITYGASSMQGWRLEQEDAHNSIIDFDKNTSFFAVYDGHGGHEVAAYCAKYLPGFLKTLEEYERNDLEAALKTLFLKFDEKLLSEEALKELGQIRDPESDNESETPILKLDEVKSDQAEDESESESTGATEQKPAKPDSATIDSIVSETAALYDEACMPLDEVLKRYANTERRVKKALNKNSLKEANSAHLSPMIAAPGSSASRKSRLKPNEIQTTPKSAAELDKQEEIDITEIKKNGHADLNGEVNCELEFDEASNLCDITDSQKEAETTPTKSDESKPDSLDKTTELIAVSTTQEITVTVTETETKVQETKHRNKLCQEEIKLSPIRNKSFSSSSICDEAASTQKDDTISEATEACESNASEGVGSSTNVGVSIDEENKENDFNNSANAEKPKNMEEESEERKEIVTTTRAAKKQSKKDDTNLIAKLIAGVINKKLRSGTRASRSKEAAKLAEAEALPDDDDDDDDFDHNYEAEEDASDESDEEETDDSEDSDEYEDEDEEESGGEEGEDEERDEEETDEDYPQAGAAPKPGFDSGCTAVVAVLRENKLYVANAGDSRCIVCRDGKAIDMSYDHKPEDDIERERVEKAGGQVTKDGRINNGLNLSRAIGDHTYKQNKDLPLAEQMITALPDVLTLDIDHAKDKFMVLACDGIWNFMSSQDVCDYIQERIDANYSKLSQICEELFMHCLAPNSEGDGTGCDNMTCILVTFQPFKKFELKISKNALGNAQAVEDKNCLKRTLENGSSVVDETNLTKKMKQEDGSSESVATVKTVTS